MKYTLMIVKYRIYTKSLSTSGFKLESSDISAVYYKYKVTIKNLCKNHYISITRLVVYIS